MDQFPLAPTKSVIRYEDLSPYSQKLVKSNYKSCKLISDLRTKHKYTLNYENLQYYLEQGLKLVKVHRVLKYDQAPIAKSVLEMTTKLRAEATSDVQISFLKYFNNCLYGKSKINILNFPTFDKY